MGIGWQEWGGERKRVLSGCPALKISNTASGAAGYEKYMTNVKGWCYPMAPQARLFAHVPQPSHVPVSPFLVLLPLLQAPCRPVGPWLQQTQGPHCHVCCPRPLTSTCWDGSRAPPRQSHGSQLRTCLPFSPIQQIFGTDGHAHLLPPPQDIQLAPLRQ